MPRIANALILLIALAAFFPGRAASYETLNELQIRWRTHLEAIKDLPQEELIARSKEFFKDVSWDQLRDYCEAEHWGPDERSILGGLINAKMRSGAGEPRVIAAMIADPDIQAACQEPITKFISQYKDSFRLLPEADLYGRAMLDLADTGSRGEAASWKLEEGAAFMSADQLIMDRMMRYGRSDDPRVAKHAVDMLQGSRDSRAPDSLIAMVRELKTAHRHPQVQKRAALIMGTLHSENVWQFLVEFRRDAKREEPAALPSDVLIGMAYCQDPRYYPILLAEYADSATGIVDATHLIKDPERNKFYYTLWHCSRVAEPGIIKTLQEDAPEAVQAVEVLDRASRFGLPATHEDLLVPLEAWGKRQGEPWAGRSAAIAARFRSYPDPAEMVRKR